MRARSAAVIVGVLLAGIFSNPLGSRAAFDGVPAGEVASPGEIAYHSLTSRLRTTPLFLEKEAGGVHFVKDQMVAILILLHRAGRQTAADDALDLRDEARALWDGSNAAYSETGGYYSVTIGTQSVCVDLPTNSWALLASRALAGEAGSTAANPRADELRDALLDAEKGQPHRGVAVCAHDIAQEPLALLALLDEYERQPDDALKAAIQDRLDLLKQDRFDDAYRDASGYYSPLTNAQMLLVLNRAAALFGGPSNVAARNGVVAFLVNRSIDRIDGVPWALGRTRSALGVFEPAGQPDPVNQCWVAYALHVHGRDRPGDVPAGLVEDLAQAVVPRFWSSSAQGLISEDRLVHFEPNALPALFFDAPMLSNVVPDDPEIRLVVPQRSPFEYPAPDASASRSLLLRNKWEARFTITSDTAGRVHALLPTGPLLGLNVSFPASDYTPPPSLQLGAQRLPAALTGTDWPLLDFTGTLQAGPNQLRLTSYAPIFPVRSNITDLVQLVLRNEAPVAVQLSSLYLEIEANNVELLGATLNDEVLPPSAFKAEGPLATEAVPDPHLGIQFFGLILAPRADAELVVHLKDVEPPAVTNLQVTLDEPGREVLQAKDGTYEVGTGETRYVRAAIKDNLALRHVYLAVTQPGAPFENATQVRMTASPNEKSVWVGVLPKFDHSGPSTLRVVAVDAHGNQGTSGKVDIQVQNALLRGGNVVLFVFSLVLFLTALVIYAKMGRKTRS